ncbi:carbonic anhydrase [Caldichromatium japonicum]|uniref:Carbonic anhydrase n=1 Tax=Caldichromatium japonicum TaxID=2699430 RepID=A0A6G7VFR9_9GAMM|nr:carbonic anhydrase [Caldichromatium japonicum]QIK38637.1 carbonic anhydrase [Caldichromatium japonicum]
MSRSAQTCSAWEALERLREGNRRFTQNLTSLDRLLTYQRRAELSAGQRPFAVILGCSDSRAPAEILFDQGLGDLFVIRVAGNVVAPSQIGSVEFAVSRYGTRLVVVLGHIHCGAIDATLESLVAGEDSDSRHIASIVERIKPAVLPLVETELRHNRSALHRAAVRANIRASANQLRHGSAIIERLIAEDGLIVIGAEYNLDSGLVDFFDGLPDA